MLWSWNSGRSEWTYADIDLTPIEADQFTLVFYVQLARRCRNSVGLDDIIFHPCPVGKTINELIHGGPAKY